MLVHTCTSSGFPILSPAGHGPPLSAAAEAAAEVSEAEDRAHVCDRVRSTLGWAGKKE